MHKEVILGEGLSAAVGIDPKTDNFYIILREKDGVEVRKLYVKVTREALVECGEGEEMLSRIITKD